MMKNLIYLCSLSMLIACSSNSNNADKQQEKKETIVSEKCIYSFNAEKTTYNWLAYKHTEKIGVPGVIDSAVVEGMMASENAQDVFKNASVSLFVPSLDSKDATRDKKIVDIFFGNMLDSEKLSGKVTAINGNGTKGIGTINLTINQVTKDVSFIYGIKEDRVKLSFTVDFNDFKGQTAIAELNKACEERHTGKDGKSILWPDVKITIISTLEKDCE